MKFLKVKEYLGKHPVKYWQVKLDGHRCMVVKDSSGVRVLTKKNGETGDDIYKKLPERAVWFLDRLPLDSIIDCELWAEGFHATDMKTLLLRKDSALVLSPFAVWMAGGVKVERTWGMEDLENFLDGWSMPTWGYVRDDGLCGYPDPLEWAESAKASNIEGFVFKKTPVDGWFKVKPKKTVDCFVLDYTVSTSDSFSGGLKAIQVGLFNERENVIEIASVGSGFSADYRMSADLGNLVGKVVEVEYDALAAKGKLKHPRFLRFREDKNPGECTVEQLETF
jgi:ATP-dependent DNA ligase